MIVPTQSSKLSDEIVALWPALAVSAIVLAASLSFQSLLKEWTLANIPMIGPGHKEFIEKGGWDFYVEGYRKFKDSLFRVPTSRTSPTIIISTRFLGELKKLPDDVLSFGAALEESMHTKYTQVPLDLATLAHTVKTSLTPSLTRLNYIIAEEVEEALRLELPQTAAWSAVQISHSLLRIIAMVSGRIFIGPELYRDEAYLDAAINYTVDLTDAIRRVNLTPSWLRPVVSPFLPEVQKLARRIEKADGFLRPVVAARREAAKDPDHQAPDDMLQWFLNSQKKFGPRQDKELAKLQLIMSFVAIHTTTTTTTNAFYTLAANPDLAPMLREDVQQALQESKGEFTNLALQNMRKLDSFLKEVIRFHPIDAGSFQRKVMKPFTLSNGQKIPAGVVIEVCQGGVNFDDVIYDSPDVFDALRFYKIQAAKDTQNSVKEADLAANSQFVSVGSSSLNFGAGRHACPGRFFAANEIKMIMANLLLHYEIKNANAEVGRYQNIQHGSSAFPNPMKMIMVRKI